MTLSTFRSPLVMGAFTALFAMQPTYSATAVQTLDWCADTTLSGRFSQSMYENHNGVKGAINVIVLDAPIHVQPAGSDCDYAAVDSDKVQIAGYIERLHPQVGEQLTVTGRLLPKSAPADQYDVILFVPPQK